eukprot:1998491-Karenia_brevis.AAC.1
MGYILPVRGKRWVEADSTVSTRVSHVARSMAFHHRHNAVLESPFPIGSQATRAARKKVSTDEYKEAMAAHERANLAKHSWPASPDLSGEKHSSSSWADVVDELSCTNEHSDDLPSPS